MGGRAPAALQPDWNTAVDRSYGTAPLLSEALTLSHRERIKVKGSSGS